MSEKQRKLPVPDTQYAATVPTMQLFEIFRKLSIDIPMVRVWILLIITRYPGVTRPQIREITGLSDTGIIRNLTELGAVRSNGKAGLNLIIAVREFPNAGAYQYYLNGYGELIMKQYLYNLKEGK